jgi:hypothetical protein
MSYDIEIRHIDCRHEDACEHPRLEVPNQEEGGTYVMGGSTDPSLNITYNYGPILHKVLYGGEVPKDGDTGLPALHALTVRQSLPLIQVAIVALDRIIESEGAGSTEDYWACTNANVRKVLINLEAWTKQAIIEEFPGVFWCRYE